MVICQSDGILAIIHELSLPGWDTAMNRALVSFGVGKHKEMLDIAWPSFKAFTDLHGWDLY